MATSSSYWCHACTRFVRVRPEDSIVCPNCDGGFLEAVDSTPLPIPTASESRHRRHRRRDRSPFNPVIVLRRPTGSDPDPEGSAFGLYYDDGSGSGLRPLPSPMSDFLMGSGFDRLLDQLAQIEANGFGSGVPFDRPPASKAAIESMPTVEIAAGHVSAEAHCAVCKEAFDLGAEAREMPCKHIYHQDCILPWLSLRNSCPVCRHELPSDVARNRDGSELDGGGDEHGGGGAVGLTIWRLPGGGFAVGRFSGGRRAGEREIPVVYTEMDGAFNAGGSPRRISWPSRGSRARERGGIGRAIHNFFAFFSRMRHSSPITSGHASRSWRRRR
ncbi:E3 ubiquitin-protein ligase RDUF2-like [Typha latifolia]|uniref:E3 ubiquitin-protein ligase RDUF2-like n=1 Tax=Typha latifolia TaxID=4733 RepID=UPI003C2E9C63